MTLVDPGRPCHACGSLERWTRPDGGEVCLRCNPPPELIASLPPVITFPELMKDDKKVRVKNGSIKSRSRA